jgi:MoaA/NifB/PqqE/SkfB family radical SAM enzyme
MPAELTSPAVMKAKGLIPRGKTERELQFVADGLATAASLQPESIVLAAWSALASGQFTFAEFGKWMAMRDELTFLTIDTTGACDLICNGMCYYHPEIDLRKGFVPEDALRRAILDSVEHLRLKSLVFAGKEPFLNPRRLFNLLDFAGTREERNFQTGIVTNGRHIHRFWSELENIISHNRLDFIDISIDSGFAAQHDQIRGVQGTFEKAFAATQHLTECFPDVRVTIPSVLRTDNVEGIIELIKLASGHVKHFQIQPIQPPPHADTKPLSTDFVVSFLHKLEDALSKDLGGRGLEVSVELLGIYQMEVAQAGFFMWQDLLEDAHGNIYIEKEIADNRLILTFETLPLQAWRLARITYEGAYLAHMHFLQTPDRESFLVGYVQNEPIAQLFKKALAANSYFQKVVESRNEHDCRTRPCWNNCFGGWNGAESSFLIGQPLTQQPRLCTKTEIDFERLIA